MKIGHFKNVQKKKSQNSLKKNFIKKNKLKQYKEKYNNLYHLINPNNDMIVL
jgi:hypothetical protein